MLPALLGLLAFVLAVSGHPLLPTAAAAAATITAVGSAPCHGPDCAGQTGSGHDTTCADHASCATPAMLPAAPTLPVTAGVTRISVPDITGHGGAMPPEPRPPRLRARAL